MKSRTDTDIFTVFIGAVIVITIAYGGFNLYRWFNWKFFYGNQVEQKIEQMVKSNCLNRGLK